MVPILGEGGMGRMATTYWVFFYWKKHIHPTRRTLAERIGEKDPVMVVQRPMSIVRHRQILPLGSRCLSPSPFKAFSDYHPLHLPERIPILRTLARRMNARYLHKELDLLLPGGTPRIIIFDSPNQQHLVGQLGEALSVYHPFDDHTLTVEGEPIKGELEAERKLLSRVDLVLCVSQSLAQRIRQRAPSPVSPPIHVLPNSYNERLFATDRNWPEPEALRSQSRPRLLVAGHISERIDWLGIREVSQKRPHWTWIFKGSADPGMQEKIATILGAKGFYHPPTALQEVPAWIEHCDVCAVPYRLNPFTLASHPVKAIEYLAMGKPVLSTRVPSLEPYEKGIEWVKEGDGEGYAGALDSLEKSLKDHNFRAWRQQIVAGDSLGTRVVQFRKILLNSLGSCRSFSSKNSSPIAVSL